MRSLLSLRFAVVLPLVLAVGQACGGGDSGGGGGGGSDGNGATSSMGGEDPQGNAGDGPSTGGKNTNHGGDTATGGTTPTGEGGAGGEANPPVAVPLKSRAGSAIVVDGVVAKSKNFKVILTLGEGPGGNTTMKSKEHRIKQGLIGSTQP